MKKLLSLLLTLGLLLTAPAALAQYDFTAADEIVTYQPIDPNRTQLVVSRTGNIELGKLTEAFEARNPDVQVIYLDITGGNNNWKPAMDWVTRGFAPDIMLTAASFMTADVTTQYFENLSGSPVINRYQTEALRRTALDGSVYWLPGPSNINCMTYNKTLFDQYGWQAPATMDEFFALCRQITADTDGAVEPWNPNAKYSLELQTALEGFAYEQLFAGADNRAWYIDFANGTASFAEHMRPYIELIQRLVDEGVLREEHFSYSATTRGKEFEAGHIAMINAAIGKFSSDTFTFAYMPFPTTQGTLGYINDTYSAYLGVPVKEHTAAERDAIDRFIDFLSSPEGQAAYIDGTLKVSNVKGASVGVTGALASLQPCIDEGHQFAVLDFYSKKIVNGIDLYQAAKQIAAGTLTADDCIANAMRDDERRETTDEQPTDEQPTAAPTPAPVATVTENMTILDTSFLIADMYRDAADADIGLIVNNAAYRGNVMRLFTGELTPTMLEVLKPRSFANESTLVKLSMTGAQLLDALNAPPGIGEQPVDALYAFSGLKCELAPWNALGGKYLSVALADGVPIDPERLYTVAAWDGTVNPAFITETLAAIDGSFPDLMSAYLAPLGAVAPADDGRATLRWAGAEFLHPSSRRSY